MRRAFLLLAVLAACNDEGVTLEIDVGDTGATTVDVFLAEQACGACDSKLWTPSADEEIEGDVFVRKNAQRFFAEVKDGVAIVKVRPGDSGNRVKFAFAVGFDGAAMKGAVFLDGEIDVSGPGRFKTALEAVTPGVNDTAQVDAPFQRAEVWTKGESQCVAFEAWTQGVDVKDPDYRRFIVPEDDPNCDGEITTPADAGVDGSGGVDAAAFCSSTPDPPEACVETHTTRCFLGTRACVAGELHCQPELSPICYPASLCAASSGCAAIDGDAAVCIAKTMNSAATVGTTRIRCTLNWNSSNGGTVPCNEGLPYSAVVQSPFASGIDCGSPALATVTATTIGTFGPTAVIEVSGGGGTSGQLRATSGANACAVVLSYAPFPPFPIASTALILQTALSTNTTVRVPLELATKKYDLGCPANTPNFACEVLGGTFSDVSLKSCATP